MSANNYLSVEPSGKRWRVWHRDADTGKGHPSELTFDSDSEALIWACENDDTEYGVKLKRGKRQVRSEKTKEDFIKYLKASPELRFWQAVRNWSGYGFILASETPPTSPSQVDTFYWEGKDEPRLSSSDTKAADAPSP